MIEEKIGDWVEVKAKLLINASRNLKSLRALPLRIYISNYSAPIRANVSHTVGFGIEPSCKQRISD